MKPNQGEIGVKEAQIGLSVLVCMLVGLGYVMIQRIGGVWDPPTVEIRSTSSNNAENYHQVPENFEPTIVMPDVQPYPFSKENISSPQAVYSTPDQNRSEAFTTFSATTNRALENNNFNHTPSRLAPSESTLPLKIKTTADQPDRSKDFIEMATRGRKLSQQKKTAAPFQVAYASHNDLENQTSNVKPTSHPSENFSKNLAGKRSENSSSALTEAPLFIAEKQKTTPPVLKPLIKKM